MTLDENEIDESHRLPCDVVVGHIVFKKGVPLKNFVSASRRWLKRAQKLSAEKLRHVDQMPEVPE